MNDQYNNRLEKYVASPIAGYHRVIERREELLQVSVGPAATDSQGDAQTQKNIQ